MTAATHIKLNQDEKKYIDEVYEPLQVVSPKVIRWRGNELI